MTAELSLREWNIINERLWSYDKLNWQSIRLTACTLIRYLSIYSLKTSVLSKERGHWIWHSRSRGLSVWAAEKFAQRAKLRGASSVGVDFISKTCGWNRNVTCEREVELDRLTCTRKDTWDGAQLRTLIDHERELRSRVTSLLKIVKVKNSISKLKLLIIIDSRLIEINNKISSRETVYNHRWVGGNIRAILRSNCKLKFARIIWNQRYGDRATVCTYIWLCVRQVDWEIWLLINLDHTLSRG